MSTSLIRIKKMILLKMLWYSCRFCCKHDIIVKFEQLSFKPVWRLQDVVYTFHRLVGSMVWRVWQVRQTASLRFVPLGTMMHSRQIAEILWLLVQLCLSWSHPPLCSRHNFIGTSACRTQLEMGQDEELNSSMLFDHVFTTFSHTS